MQRKTLTLLAVPVLAIALAASAVAFVPGILNALSTGSSPATSFAAPTWKAGDSWTYNVSLASWDAGEILPGEMLPQSSMATEAHVMGTLVETVVGSVDTPYGPAWNTTVNATLGFGNPQPMAGMQTTAAPLAIRPVTVSGFVWYRASDLAPVYALRTVDIRSTWNTSESWASEFGLLANQTCSLRYTATTQVWFAPPLVVWHFPLAENESWNVSSNATIHYTSSFGFQSGNATFESDHSMNFTVPVDFAMRTGTFENVTTPAGAFRALSVSAVHRTFHEIPDRDASAMLNLTAATDVDMPHAFASAWFSAQAGNAVKAQVGLGGLEGPRVELDLVSYTYG